MTGAISYESHIWAAYLPMTPIMIVDTNNGFQIWSPTRQSISHKYAHVSHPKSTPTALRQFSPSLFQKHRCEPPTLSGNPIVLLKCLIASFTSREREAAVVAKNFFKNGMGYFAEQSTKPQTLGFSLADSPIGMLAWIYEKLVAWTDAYPWTDDEGASIPTISPRN